MYMCVKMYVCKEDMGPFVCICAIYIYIYIYIIYIYMWVCVCVHGVCVSEYEYLVATKQWLENVKRFG